MLYAFVTTCLILLRIQFTSLYFFKRFISKLQDIMGTLPQNNEKQAYSVCGRNANGRQDTWNCENPTQNACTFSITCSLVDTGQQEALKHKWSKKNFIANSHINDFREWDVVSHHFTFALKLEALNNLLGTLLCSCMPYAFFIFLM